MIINHDFFVLGRPSYTPAAPRLGKPENVAAEATLIFAVGISLKEYWDVNYIIQLTGDKATQFRNLQWDDIIKIYGSVDETVKTFDIGFEKEGSDSTELTAPVIQVGAISSGGFWHSWDSNELHQIGQWHEENGTIAEFTNKQQFTRT